jgi:hypothetical protein
MVMVTVMVFANSDKRILYARRIKPEKLKCGPVNSKRTHKQGNNKHTASTSSGPDLLVKHLLECEKEVLDRIMTSAFLQMTWGA